VFALFHFFSYKLSVDKFSREINPLYFGAFIEIQVSTLKISPPKVFFKSPLTDQWWPHESKSSKVQLSKSRPPQPLGAKTSLPT